MPSIRVETEVLGPNRVVVYFRDLADESDGYWEKEWRYEGHGTETYTVRHNGWHVLDIRVRLYLGESTPEVRLIGKSLENIPAWLMSHLPL
jgi:hypothetical protein